MVQKKVNRRNLKKATKLMCDWMFPLGRHSTGVRETQTNIQSHHKEKTQN